MSATIYDIKPIDFKTNPGGIGLVGAFLKHETELTDDHHYRIFLPHDPTYASKDIACMTFEKVDFDKIDTDIGGELKSIKYVQHKLVNDRTLETTCIEVPWKAPVMKTASVLCSVKVPNVNVDAEGEVFFSKDKGAGDAVKFEFEVEKGGFAEGISFLGTGEKSKPGMKLTINKMKVEGLKSIKISDTYDFASVLFGATGSGDVICDGQVAGQKDVMTITAINKHSIKISFTKPTKVDGPLSVDCKDGISAIKTIPGFPAIIKVSSGEPPVEGVPIITSFATGTADMKNSSVSISAGVAVVATVASVFAMLF